MENDCEIWPWETFEEWMARLEAHVEDDLDAMQLEQDIAAQEPIDEIEYDASCNASSADLPMILSYRQA